MCISNWNERAPSSNSMARGNFKTFGEFGNELQKVYIHLAVKLLKLNMHSWLRTVSDGHCRWSCMKLGADWVVVGCSDSFSRVQPFWSAASTIRISSHCKPSEKKHKPKLSNFIFLTSVETQNRVVMRCSGAFWLNIIGVLCAVWHHLVRARIRAHST